MKGMKWPLRIGVALCVIVVGWMGAVAWVHLRVRGLLHDLRADVESYDPPDFRRTTRAMDLLTNLERHGCRALPVLIDEFQPDAPSAYLVVLSSTLNSILFRPEARRPEMPEEALLLRDLEVDDDDTPAEVRRKCEGLRRWWTTQGYRYHQSWRFWSTACPRR